MKAYLWRDQHDHDQYLLGESNNKGGYVAWTMLFTDALYAFAAKEIRELADAADGIPIPVEITIVPD